MSSFFFDIEKKAYDKDMKDEMPWIKNQYDRCLSLSLSIPILEMISMMRSRLRSFCVHLKSQWLASPLSLETLICGHDWLHICFRCMDIPAFQLRRVRPCHYSFAILHPAS